MGDFSEYPKSKAEAIRLGRTYYFTGCVCPKGHVDLRTAHRGECRRCHTIGASPWLLARASQAIESIAASIDGN